MSTNDFFASSDDLQKLLQICLRTGGIVGNDLYYSLVKGVEYELLIVNGIEDFISRMDFNDMKKQVLKEYKRT